MFELDAIAGIINKRSVGEHDCAVKLLFEHGALRWHYKNDHWEDMVAQNRTKNRCLSTIPSLAL